MNILNNTFTDTDLSHRLRDKDITPTAQRVAILRCLLEKWTHMSAEEVHRLVNSDNDQVSKATVYNTLGLFAEKGLVREVIADPTRVFYDPNTTPHHHFYDIDTGELTDFDAADVAVAGLPSLPAGSQLAGVDVIVRLRSARQN